MNPTTNKPNGNVDRTQVSASKQAGLSDLADLRASGTSPAMAPGFEPNREILLVILTFGLAALTKPSAEANLRFHAYHSLFYAVAALAGQGLLSIFYGVFGPFMPLYESLCVGGFAFLILRAWQGRPTTFPILTAMASKQAGI